LLREVVLRGVVAILQPPVAPLPGAPLALLAPWAGRAGVALAPVRLWGDRRASVRRRADARATAYAACELVTFPDMRYRRDIAAQEAGVAG